MKQRFIISITAANRVGFMANVTTALADLGAELVEISQTSMQGFFNILLAADFPLSCTREIVTDHLKDACRAYQARIVLKVPTDELVRHQERCEGCTRFLLTITGQDQPGMIRHLSSRMAQDDINIRDLYAMRDEESGRFVLSMELDVPRQAPLHNLNEELSLWAASIGAEARVTSPRFPSLKGKLLSSLREPRSLVEGQTT